MEPVTILAVVAAVAVVGFVLGSFFGPSIVTTIENESSNAVKAARALIAAEEARAVALLHARKTVTTQPPVTTVITPTATIVTTPTSVVAGSTGLAHVGA